MARKTTDTHALQARLKALGFDPGPVDGEYGDRTRAAVEAFQLVRGLHVDGIVGPRTTLALWPSVVTQRVSPTAPRMVDWFRFAIAEIGVKETAGRGSTARVIAYRKLGKTTDDLQTDDSKRPWCGDFRDAMLETAGVRSARSGMARAVESSPHFIRLDQPALGAIVTFWRNYKGSGLGHTGFYGGHLSDGRIVVVGGNQSDAVTAADYSVGPTSRFVGYWWPKDVAIPHLGRVPAVIQPGASAGKEV